MKLDKGMNNRSTYSFANLDSQNLDLPVNFNFLMGQVWVKQNLFLKWLGYVDSWFFKFLWNSSGGRWLERIDICFIFVFISLILCFPLFLNVPHSFLSFKKTIVNDIFATRRGMGRQFLCRLGVVDDGFGNVVRSPNTMMQVAVATGMVGGGDVPSLPPIMVWIVPTEGTTVSF